MQDQSVIGDLMAVDSDGLKISNGKKAASYVARDFSPVP